MNRIKPHLQNGVVHECIYTAIIYEDSTSYDFQQVLDVLCSYPDYAFIRHNLEDVKPHYHILFRFPEKKQLNVVASELGIPENIIKWRNSFKDSFQYLTHESKGCKKDVENKLKFIYPHELITSSFSDEEVEKFFSKSKRDLDLEESNSVLIILDYMESDEPKRYRDVLRWACKNNLYSFLRRSGSHLTRCFDEIQNDKQSIEYREKLKARYEAEKVTKENTPAVGFVALDDEQLEF